LFKEKIDTTANTINLAVIFGFDVDNLSMAKGGFYKLL
jgi:hypothetical protein